MVVLVCIAWLVLVTLLSNQFVAAFPDLEEDEQQLLLAAWVTGAGLVLPVWVIVARVSL
jgi:hypothetical protein